MRKEEIKNMADVKRQEWEAKKIAEEATNMPEDEVLREMLRGDETEGDPDDRDVAGSPEFKDTAYGREEAKKHNTESD